MIEDLAFATLGLVILLLAGDALVRGAVNLSLRLGVPALIVSLTIVAFGTSAPELLISVGAVLEDAPGLALGNVVGSNTANVLLVLGIPALMTGIATRDCETRKSFVFMLAATALFIGLAYWGPLTLVSGVILLVVLTAMLADQLFEARAHRRSVAAEAADEAAADKAATNEAAANAAAANEAVANEAAADEAAADEVEEFEVEVLDGADPEMPWWRIALFLALGLIGLPLGADLLVDSAVDIAEDIGVSETVIGLTLVAVGTSLPELATTVMAALRRHAEVALGNVIGSNMFNLLGIMGIATLFGTIPIDPAFLRFDLWIMAGASLLLAPFAFKLFDMTRTWGAALTLAYVTYIWIILS